MMENQKQSDIYSYPFVVNEKAYCVWDKNLPKNNLDFIKNIDPQYFNHVSGIHSRLLETEERQYAALMLRTTYSHSLETLFSLICATIQAPECISGWLIKYANKDLDQMVKKIHNSQPVLTRLDLDQVTWDSFASCVFEKIKQEPEEVEKTQRLFSNLWKRFAFDFLNDLSSYEYNSIKHGFRVNLGGFKLDIGVKDAESTDSTPNMTRVGESEFGSTFFLPENINDRINISLQRQMINWNPLNYANRLNLVSVSITNILCFLHIYNRNITPDQKYLIPVEEHFELPWEDKNSLINASLNIHINPKDIKPYTEQDVIFSYQKVDT